MDVEHAKLDLEFEANHARNPRERAIIRGMEDYFTRNREGDSGGRRRIGGVLVVFN